MKKILLLLSCLFGSAIAVQAQSFANNDKGVFLRAELRALARSKSDGVAQRGMDVEAIVGYRFDGRFSLFIPVTATTGLFKAGGVKSYEQAGQLGLGFGYAPLHTTRDRLEIAVRAGNTLGGSWHFRYYDLGVRWEWADLKIRLSSVWVCAIRIAIRAVFPTIVFFMPRSDFRFAGIG